MEDNKEVMIPLSEAFEFFRWLREKGYNYNLRHKKWYTDAVHHIASAHYSKYRTEE